MDTSLQNIKFTINRKGNISLYGDISIEFIPSLGKSFFIGAANGVGVYTNIDKRNMAVKINNTSGKALKNGKYRVRYTSSGDAKPVVYAEADLIVKK